MAANIASPELPTELIQMVCIDLDAEDLLRCIAINKNWRAAIFGSRPLMRRLSLPFDPDLKLCPRKTSQKIKAPSFCWLPPMGIAISSVGERWLSEPALLQQEISDAMSRFRIMLRHPVDTKNPMHRPPQPEELHSFLCRYLLSHVETKDGQFREITLSVMILREMHNEGPKESLWKDMYMTWPPVPWVHLGISFLGRLTWNPRVITRDTGVTMGDVVEEIYRSTLPDIIRIGFWDGQRCLSGQEWVEWRQNSSLYYRLREKLELLLWGGIGRYLTTAHRRHGRVGRAAMVGEYSGRDRPKAGKAFPRFRTD